MESLVANDEIGVLSTTISDDEKNLLNNPYYMVCNSANHRSLSNSCEIVIDLVTVDVLEELDCIPIDIECHDVVNSYIEDKNDNCDTSYVQILVTQSLRIFVTLLFMMIMLKVMMPHWMTMLKLKTNIGNP